MYVKMEMYAKHWGNKCIIVSNRNGCNTCSSTRQLTKQTIGNLDIMLGELYSDKKSLISI
jgi:hypothetical protein